MAKNAFIRARIEPELKILAERVLNDLGITPTQAITMLYKKVTQEHAWPLIIKIPNAETQKAFAETDRGVGLTECKNVDDLFDKLGFTSATNKISQHIRKRSETR